MSKYRVCVPVTGCYYIEVEADNEEDAKENALNVDFSLDAKSEDETFVFGEFETHDYVVRGNVCSAVQWEIEVEDI